jgi:nitrate reductase NapE component
MNQAEKVSQETKQKASLFQIIKAVLWSMLGVRQQKGYEDDTAKITLKQAVIAGLIGGVVFVVSMLTIVSFVIKYAGK